MSALARLFDRVPRPLQAAGVAAIGAFYDWERHGGAFEQMLRDAEAATFAPPDALRSSRERTWRTYMGGLCSIAAYGGRELGLADVAALPLLRKKEVRERVHEFVSPEVRPWQRVKLHTSGSTGAGLELLATRASIRRSYAFTWRYRRWHGIDRGEWRATFTGRSVVSQRYREPPFWQVNPLGRTTHYSQYHLDERTVRDYVRHLSHSRVRWIHGYPSFVAHFAQLAVDAGLGGTTNVRWVTVSSETLFEWQRRAIERMFGVAPRQQYGATESVAMFSECPSGRIHVDEDYSLVEFVPVAGDPSRHHVVGSTLDNAAFPLLRYELGDVVEIAADPCPCGRSGRVVAAIDGRKEDFIVLADGARVGRVDGMFKGAVHVAEAQLVQRTPGEVTLRIVRAPGYAAADEAALLREGQSRFGDRLRIALEYVAALPRTPSGKVRLVVSELGEASVVR